MGLEKIKSLFLSQGHQFLVLDKIGVLEKSCNSLVNLDNWINSPIYFNIPFFETLKVDIDEMEIGQRNHYTCFSFPFNERLGTYDITIQKEIIDDEQKFVCVIEDRTEQYKYWLSIQQERNESQINAEVIEKQSRTIKEANREITDSINYANRIQKKILPSKEELNKVLPEHFLLYKPKDIISGDFYWVHQNENKKYFCAADATGHGVPGAIMSVIGNSLFNDAISNLNSPSPSSILDYARNGIIDTLKQNFEPGSQFDGMDAAMCCINNEKNILEFAGANNPMLIYTKKKDFLEVRNSNTGELEKKEAILSNNEYSLFDISADKIPIALFNGRNKSFTNYEVQVSKGDRVFLFSDGYRDQFGGMRQKKIGYRMFKDLIFETSSLELEYQKINLRVALESWRGNLDQIDDVCVLGVKI